MKITQTRNYDQFASDETNRPINKKHNNVLRKLEASMKQYGFLPFPILVKREGNKFKILDGQHRFAIAEKLKLPFYYVETDRDDIKISNTAECQRPWSIGDFVSSYAAQGQKNYLELKAFAESFGLPFARAAAILSGNGAGSNGAGSLKDGGFVVKDRAYAERIASIVSSLRQIIPWVATSNSLNAISRFVRVSEFDDQQLIKKAAAHSYLLKKQPTTETYSQMYDEVYNHASRQRIPLAFLAKEAAAKRNPQNRGKTVKRLAA